MTIFQSAAAAVCSCLDSLAAGAAAATASRFYIKETLGCMLFLPQLRQKDCIILAEEMFELCAFSSNSSSLSHNLHKKKPLDEVWLLPLKDILIFLCLIFLFQICDRISIASTASDVSQISSNSHPSPVTFPQFHRALRGLLLTSCFEAWPRRVLS